MMPCHLHSRSRQCFFPPNPPHAATRTQACVLSSPRCARARCRTRTGSTRPDRNGAFDVLCARCCGCWVLGAGCLGEACGSSCDARAGAVIHDGNWD
ncbi:hypothetical protein DENSPDRAFT_409356 [Dentipellis sp. KUC8613]|nr:hypothetical protein DENSPDRAFT_409356 [Dentipellis sp. KUC8613]